MYIKQSTDGGIQYQGGILFESLITDPIVANGRRQEYSSLHRQPTETGRWNEWQTYIPRSWEIDDTWCVIAQYKGKPPGSPYGSPVFAVELTGDNLLAKVRVADKSTFLFAEPIESFTGRWLQFQLVSRWTHKNNGYQRIYIDGQLMGEFNGQTYYDYATGPYFKCGLYVSNKSNVRNRQIWHRV